MTDSQKSTKPQSSAGGTGAAEAEAASVVPPEIAEQIFPFIAMERLEAAMGEIGWKALTNKEQGQLEAVFDGFMTVFQARNPQLLFSYMLGTGLFLPIERMEEALDWATEWNKTANFGTAIVLTQHNEKTGQDRVAIRSEICLPVPAGVSDAQLLQMLRLVVSCNYDALTSFARRFRLPLPGGPQDQENIKA